MAKDHLLVAACALVLIGMLGVLPAAGAETGKIAFVSLRDGNPEIYTMNPDGSGQVRLTDNAADDLEPAWSPDGTRIAFISTRDGDHKLFVMNADGTGVSQLTDYDAGEPAWSPDGTRIAFNAASDVGVYDLYTVRPDGTGVARITTGGQGMNADAAWSPDGSRIAFVSLRDGNFEIYTMNADGSGQIRLTTNGEGDVEPAWSPGGSLIAFTSWRDGPLGEVYVMKPDGTGQTRLTDNGVWDGGPAWSPDGSRLAFYSYRDGNGEIYVMIPDGTAPTRLTTNTADDYYPAWWGVYTTGQHVTGGGWITSPAGAWSAAPAMTGKATFDFVSKYQTGATVPKGTLKFRFGPAGLTFLSTGYDWLGVVGAKAQVLGRGTINGAGDYGFRLSAIDAKGLGIKKPDLFRLRVWDRGTGAIVYDSQPGVDEYADPTTALGGGSIVIH